MITEIFKPEETREYHQIILTGFLSKIPFALGILYPPERETEVQEQLRSLSSQNIGIDPIDPWDGPGLDRKLSGLLNQSAFIGLPAAVTACAWKCGPRAGSVIGLAGSADFSADENVSEVSPGLWCGAYPGGPGYLIAADRKKALYVDQEISVAHTLGTDPLPAFLKACEKEKIKTYLFVTDGSGGDGLIAASALNGKKLEHLPPAYPQTEN
ncbi:MAG: hypothetical protein PUC44_00065 [Eubacteriales bacterium]|nr:hypothetical protein [Eubacteriales bacterium]